MPERNQRRPRYWAHAAVLASDSPRGLIAEFAPMESRKSYALTAVVPAAAAEFTVLPGKPIRPRTPKKIAPLQVCLKFMAMTEG